VEIDQLAVEAEWCGAGGEAEDAGGLAVELALEDARGEMRHAGGIGLDDDFHDGERRVS